MNALTWFAEEAFENHSIDFRGGQLAACTQRSPDKSTDNEDSAAMIQLSDSHGLLAIADGMGGHHAGDRASKAVIQAIAKQCKNAQPGVSLRGNVLDAIEYANRKILGWKNGAGATLVAMELLDNRLRVVHVGDSSALVCSSRGNLKCFTVAHAPVAMAVELGIMEEDEALVHEDRNLIDNYVGSKTMRIEVGPTVRLARRDSILLASDGLFDNFTTVEVVDLIRIGKMETQFELMLEQTRRKMAKDQGKPDDLSILFWRPR